MKSSDTAWNEFALVVEQSNSPDVNLIKEHAQKLADAVAYECQKHVLTKLMDHARGHREGTAATGPVDEMWAHEIEYIEKNMAVLEQMFNPQPSAYIGILKELFPHLEIISFDEIFGSADTKQAEPIAEPAPDPERTRHKHRETYVPVVNERLRANFKATHVHLTTLGRYMHILDASDEATGDVRSIYCNAEGHTFDRPASDFHDTTRFGRYSS